MLVQSCIDQIKAKGFALVFYILNGWYGNNF